ncbi:MAG TPA: hypothetical protein VHZ51_09495 [Ktedonobacteraceae bacterium]|jgi:hypothetical protein|nr:hypothetical protein [Ktedonobacteraceae bacterium]
MGNLIVSGATQHAQNDWSSNEMSTQGPEKGRGLVQWWYDTTAIPEVPTTASFVKREAARKSHLFSTVMFYFTLVIIVLLPCCLLLPNKYAFWVDALLVVVSIMTLGMNRRGQTLAAGIVIVVAFQAALTTIIFTTTPFDEPSIQLFDLYLMTALLAVSLLPARSVFIVALANSACILLSLFYEQHMPLLNADLHAQFIAIMVRPIALQWLIAGVAYVWAYSTSKAIARADRAEMVATLEHALVDQKRDLEDGIEQILETHVAIANGNLNARAPMTQESMLWQLARALNTLLIRFQRATLAERELQGVEQAVANSVNAIQEAEAQNHRARLPFTHTAIDPLIAALQGKNLAYTQSPVSVYPPLRQTSSTTSSDIRSRTR